MKIARNQWNDDGHWFVTNGDPLAPLVKEALTSHFNAENVATGCVVELLSPIKSAAKDTATFEAIVGIGKHGEEPVNKMIEGVLVFSTHLKNHPLIKDQLIVETTMMVRYNEDTGTQKVSEAILEVADNWVKDHEKNWGGGKDPAMVKVGHADAEDLRGVASLVQRNLLKEARNEANHLDTIVREELPESFFRLLEKNNVRW